MDLLCDLPLGYPTANLKRWDVQEVKQKLSVQEVNSKILNLFEKVFYCGDTKFSYSACQWIWVDAVKISVHVHHKICEHGGECSMKVWVLDHRKHSIPVSCLSLAWTYLYKNCAIRRDIKIHDKLTDSQQILVGIQNYNLVLIWRWAKPFEE